MTAAQLKRPPVARTGMMIRKPVATVFGAFIDPDVTTQFWFTQSSGRLEPGGQVTWEWEMYDAETNVKVIELVQDKRLVIEWDGYSGRTRVEWKFASLDSDATFVSIAESGWTGDLDTLIEYVANATQGFTWTLAGLKGLLEHGIRLNFVPDRFPRGPKEPYPDR